MRRVQASVVLGHRAAAPRQVLDTTYRLGPRLIEAVGLFPELPLAVAVLLLVEHSSSAPVVGSEVTLAATSLARKRRDAVALAVGVKPRKQAADVAAEVATAAIDPSQGQTARQESREAAAVEDRRIGPALEVGVVGSRDPAACLESRRQD